MRLANAKWLCKTVQVSRVSEKPDLVTHACGAFLTNHHNADFESAEYPKLERGLIQTRLSQTISFEPALSQ